MDWLRNKDKRIIVVVGGYVRKEVYETIDKWMDDAGAGYERHIYPYNSEGYQLHVVSNTHIDMNHDLVDATFNGSFTDEEEQGLIQWETINEYTERPKGGMVKFTGPNYGGEWYTLGTIQGYDHDSDERYEC